MVEATRIARYGTGGRWSHEGGMPATSQPGDGDPVMAHACASELIDPGHGCRLGPGSNCPPRTGAERREGRTALGGGSSATDRASLFRTLLATTWGSTEGPARQQHRGLIHRAYFLMRLKPALRRCPRRASSRSGMPSLQLPLSGTGHRAPRRPSSRSTPRPLGEQRTP